MNQEHQASQKNQYQEKSYVLVSKHKFRRMTKEYSAHIST